MLEMEALIHRHPSNLNDDVWLVGLPTFLVLVTSWILPCLVLELVGAVMGPTWSRVLPSSSKADDDDDDNNNNNVKPTNRRKVLLWNFINLLFLAFITPFASPFLSIFFGAATPLSLAEVKKHLLAALVAILVLDFWSFAFHRMMHRSPRLFRLFHAKNHFFKQRFCWTGCAMHPFELGLRKLGLFLGLIVSRSVFYSREDPMPLLLVQLAFASVNVHSACVNSGYRLPVLDSFGFLAGAKFHNDHHRFQNVNFGEITTIWDYLFGTLAN